VTQLATQPIENLAEKTAAAGLSIASVRAGGAQTSAERVAAKAVRASA
jgi:hypothetical protein